MLGETSNKLRANNSDLSDKLAITSLVNNLDNTDEIKSLLGIHKILQETKQLRNNLLLQKDDLSELMLKPMQDLIKSLEAAKKKQSNIKDSKRNLLIRSREKLENIKEVVSLYTIIKLDESTDNKNSKTWLALSKIKYWPHQLLLSFGKTFSAKLYNLLIYSLIASSGGAAINYYILGGSAINGVKLPFIIVYELLRAATYGPSIASHTRKAIVIATGGEKSFIDGSYKVAADFLKNLGWNFFS